MKVGIDSIAFDIPRIYLPIQTLAEYRNIEPDKLIKGLGLTKMSFLDIHQDVISMAINAVYKLIVQENIDPTEINRIYVGSESGLDASKPIASYIISVLEQKIGTGVFRNCDALDMTFACIGAVDAMHNCLDYIRLNPTKKAIVVATDFAKYDLNSTGEYTQGAGAIALLLTENPRLMTFSTAIGVSTEGVFDFFKPKRYVSKEQLTNQNENPEFLGILENEVAIHKEQPIFDGQYSNLCYVNRIVDAYQNFKQESNQTGAAYQNWENILMHLPYCFQGRRTFIEIYAQENPEINLDPTAENYKDRIKEIAKSKSYLDFVTKKIAPSEVASGQVGNIYTGSIFLGLLSALCFHFKENNKIENKKFGFIAYGSGSKSKVFEAEIAQDWKTIIEKIKLFEILDLGQEINFETYLKLHKKEQKTSVSIPENEFVLDYIETQNPVLIGSRYYKFV